MGNVIVLYHSQEYGNTEAMAEAVAEGLREAGAEAVLVNTNRQRFTPDEYREFDGACFGSPDYYSYVAGGLKMFLDDWYIANRENSNGIADKPYGLFYSHGGGGKVKDILENLCQRLGGKIGETVESVGSPGVTQIEECRKLGKKLAEAVS